MSLSSAGGRYQPIPAQAEITRNVFYDYAEAQLRAANADAQDAYFGGNERTFLQVKPGEIVLAQRHNGHVSGGYGMGKGREIGLTSVNGLRWGDYSSNPIVAKELFLDSVYHVGVAKTENEDGIDSYGYTDPLEHGFSAIGSGSFSVPHYGPDPIYAGDILVYDIPDPKARSMNVHSKGLLPGKMVPFYRPLRTTESTPTLMCIIAALRTPKSNPVNPGVQGLTADELEYSLNLTSLQEEALAMYKFGKSLSPDPENYGLEQAAKIIEDNMGAFKALFDAMMKSTIRRMGRMAGVAMSSTVQGQTTAVMLSHYKAV